MNDEIERDLINFIQTAYGKGYGLRHDEYLEIEVCESGGRSILLVLRGRSNGWEPFLSECDQAIRLGPQYGFEETRCICIRPPFRSAAHFALMWLRGLSLESVLADFEFPSGRPEGIVLRSDVEKAIRSDEH